MLGVELDGSSRIWPAHVGCLVDPVGSRRSRRIVWMSKPMTKQGRQLDHLTAADLDPAVDPHRPTW
jgi:hypothetical protein